MEQRDRWDNEVLTHMVEAMDSGNDPYDVLRVIIAMGYSTADVVRLSLKFESMLGRAINMQRDVMPSEDHIAEHAQDLVAGIENYLQKQCTQE